MVRGRGRKGFWCRDWNRVGVETQEFSKGHDDAHDEELVFLTSEALDESWQQRWIRGRGLRGSRGSGIPRELNGKARCKGTFGENIVHAHAV